MNLAGMSLSSHSEFMQDNLGTAAHLGDLIKSSCLNSKFMILYLLLDLFIISSCYFLSMVVLSKLLSF